jgi:hypothetical protein
LLHLAQRFLLREQEHVLAGFDGLRIWPGRLGRVERWKLRRDESKSDRETHQENRQQDAPNLAIPTMAAGAAPPNDPGNTPRFRLIQQLLPTFATGILGSGLKATSLSTALQLDGRHRALNPHKMQGI